MSSPNTLYLVHLQGQGGTYWTLVPKNILDWVCTTQTPGRTGNERQWLDTATPPEINQGKPIWVAVESYPNDRAMHVDSIPGVITFTNIVTMLKWYKDNDVTVEEGFEGTIY